jgi:alcohol dehydrogenase
MAIVATHGGSAQNYAGGKNISGEVIPIVAIPTTAGTGSEVTFSSVISDSQKKYKFSIRHTKIAPKFAIVDPEMTVTMPSDLTAATGMDALTHAIEAFTARPAEPIGDAVALYAVELITKYLRAAVDDGTNMEARAGMLMGSLLAGIGFSHSDVAGVHCLAETLGGIYDAAHGVCNAMVLPAMMEYNFAYCKSRYARLATAMDIAFDSEEEGARQAVAAVKSLAADVGIPHFKTLGVDENDYEELALKSELNLSNKSNPRPLTKDDYLVLLNQLAAQK